MPRSTTGSVDARMAPPIKAISHENPTTKYNETAPRAMIMTVPGPRIKTGTSHLLPNSSICSFIASKKSTMARVRVATISNTGSCAPI